MKKILFSVLLATASIVAPLAAHAQISVSVNIAPPELPVYVQPPIPGDGYMWTPGYWAWSPDDQDYYWVPGTWVEAPYVGALWTPGYWGWAGGNYRWNQGYWGDHIGFYGGVNYGFGYVGVGYLGGHWDHGGFAYNRAVNNVSNVHVTNVYNTVVNNNNVTRTSFNGGNGGIRMQPNREEVAFAHAQHTGPLPTQIQHEQTARGTPELRASVNHGAPSIAATPTPGKFNMPNVVPARGAAPTPAMNARPGGGENGNVYAPHPTQQAQPQAPQRGGVQPQQLQPQPHAVVQQPSPAQPQQQFQQRPMPQQNPQPQQFQQHPMPQQAQPQPRPQPMPQVQQEQRPQAQPQPHPAPAPAHPSHEQDEHHEK